MKIRLHKTQGIPFQDTSRFSVIAAARRWGKTVLACVKLFVSAVKTKDGLYWLVAPTYGQAKELAWGILKKIIQPWMLAKAPNETELSFKFKNGAEIHLKGADNPETLRGRGLDGLVIDEVASIRNAKSVWEEVLRPALADKKGWCMFIGTPKGKNYFWELWMRGQKVEDGFKSWRFKTSDNPFIDPEEIEAARKSLSPRHFRQEFEASFEDFTGLIWPEIDNKVIIDPFVIPDGWNRLGAIDPAISGITGALYGAVDFNGVLYIYNEFREADKRVSEVVAALKEKGEVAQWWIDPAAKGLKTVSEGKVYTLWDEYEGNGLLPFAGENDVDAGINRVAEYAKSGRLKIFNTCKQLLWEIDRYHWSEEKETVNGLMKPKPYKVNDHLVDCLRYLVMSRPSDPEPRKTIKPGTEEYYDNLAEYIKERDEYVDGLVA